MGLNEDIDRIWGEDKYAKAEPMKLLPAWNLNQQIPETMQNMTATINTLLVKVDSLEREVDKLHARLAKIEQESNE